MKKIKHFTYGLLLLGLLGFNSCNKDGCTDVNAKNYNSEANKNDGSCQYNGDILIWFTQSGKTQLEGHGTETMYIFIDDQQVGTMSTSEFVSAEPNCGEGKGFNYQTEFSGENTKKVKIKILDQDGFSVFVKTLDVIGGQCNKVQIGTMFSWG